MTEQASKPTRSLLGKLGSLREQTGNVVGDVYARTARTLLKRLETIQDRRAERRYHRQGKAASSSPSLGATSEVKSLPSTPKTRV